MNYLTQAIRSPLFWAYLASAGVGFALAYAALFWFGRKGYKLDDFRQQFWSWLLPAAAVTVGMLLEHEVFAVLVAGVAVFAGKEFARATGLYDDWLFTGLVYLLLLGAHAVALGAGGGPAYLYDLFMATPIYAVALLCLLPVARNRADGMLQRVALAVMAFVYYGYFLAHLTLLAGARAPEMYGYVYFLFYGTLTTALAGWLVERRFGRHVLVARITTEVTWEGWAASLTWAALWSFAVGWSLPAPFCWVGMVLASLVLGIAGPVGDLVMRSILRDLGLKPPAQWTGLVPYLALHHLNRLIFAAPLFFRVARLLDPGLLHAKLGGPLP